MDLLNHISINMFSIVMLFVIYTNNQKKVTKTPDKKLFDMLIVLTLCFMLVNILCHGLAEVTFQTKDTAMWLAYIVQMLISFAIPCVWLLYICYRLHVNGKGLHTRVLRGVVTGLYLCIVLLAVGMPWTHLFFYITEEGNYQRGNYSVVVAIVEFLVMFFGVLTAGYVWTREEVKERRMESLGLVICGILTLIGFSVQQVFVDWWIGGPCMALVLLELYINTQNQQIVTDSLTGLNNRGEFNQYLKKKSEKLNGSDLGMLLIDVDNFKSINDNLGHGVGDEALWQTADILRVTLGMERTFLARYGGDEFVVIGDWQDKQSALDAIARIKTAVTAFNAESEKPYHLSLSIGYAMWSEVHDVEAFVSKADERMYEEKTKKKAERRNRV